MVDKLQKKNATPDAADAVDALKASGQRARFDPERRPQQDSQLRRRFATEEGGMISGFEHAARPPRRPTPTTPLAPRRSTKGYGEITGVREELVKAPVRHDSRSEGYVEPSPEADVGESGIPTPRPKLSLAAVPRRAMGETELRSLPLDHRAGFVLAHIDGVTSMRTLLDVCGMSHEVLAGVVERLLALRAIVLR